MFSKLKHGAVYALIICFLSQPVWAATAQGPSVQAVDPFVNNALIEVEAIEPSALAGAFATGIGFDGTYKSVYGHDVLVNDVFGEIRATARHTSSETVFSSKNAEAYGFRGLFGADGILIRNIGDIYAEANTITPVPHNTHGMATAHGILTITNNDVENSGNITALAHGTSSVASGISTDGTDMTNELGGVIDIEAHAGSGSSYAVGMRKHNAAGSIINHGQVSVSGERTGGSTSSSVYTYGIRSEGALNSYINTGTIDVQGKNTDGLLEVAGIYLAGSAPGVATFANTGTINVEGISSDGTTDTTRKVSGIYGSQRISIDNSGDIAVSSSGASSTNGFDSAEDTFVNTGTLTVFASNGLDNDSYEGASGLKVLAGNFTNSGKITVSDTSTKAIAKGIGEGWGDIIDNSGNISVLAGDSGVTTGSTAIAIGVNASVSTNTNTGTISATADSDASALAIAMVSGGWTSFTNDSDIVARASALDATAIGVEATTSFVNDGRIVASSTGAATGIKSGEWGSGTITNTGVIDVAGADATGIYLNEGNWQIASSGTIQGYTATDVMDEGTWTATNAFRTLRVGQDAFSAPASATLTSDFQVILDGDPDGLTYLAPIFVADGSSLDLNSQNLVATPGANVILNRGYRIIENEGTVIGTFGGLVAGNPAIQTDWTGADNGENAEVTFEYQPATPPAPAEVAVTMADTATEQLRQFAMGNALRGTEIDPDGPTAIVRPWTGNLNRSQKNGVGYNAGMSGVLAGIEVPVSGDLVVGGHFVAGGASVDYTGTGYSSNSEDQTMYGLGAHGRWTPDNWYVDGMLTSYMVSHDYSGRTGLNLELGEDDEYESYGIEGSLIGGHKFRHDNITAMPFAGLGYSWINTPGHETETATGTWQTKYGSLDQHNVRAIVGARVSAEYAAFDGTITPSLGLRYEHSLTDNDIRIRQSLQGASETVKGERADVSMILDAGLSYGRGPLALEIGGSIEKNDDYDAQSGFVGVRWTF